MMRIRSLSGLLALGASAALLAGCTASPSSSPAAGGDSSANIYLYQAPVVFNPLAPAQGAEQLTQQLVFDNLVTTSPAFEIEPRLAKEWDISEDYKTYTFHLESDLKWSDGEPLTAEDVVFSYNLYANPAVASAAAGKLAGVEGYAEFQSGAADALTGVQAIDENTVEIRLAAGDPGFLSLIAGPVMFILPQHVLGEVDPAAIMEHEFFKQPTVSSGPYVMEKFNVDQDIVLAANEEYRQEVGIDTLYLKILTSDVATAQLATGEIDLAQISPLDLATVEGTAGVEVSSAPSAGFLRLLVNAKNFPDERVRQAMLYAIDRQGLIDGVLDGKGQISNSTFLAQSALPDDLEAYEYSPEKAKSLLEEADFDFSKEIKLSWIPGTADRDAAVTVVLEQLKAVGINAVANQIDAAGQLPMIENAEYDLMVSGGGTYAVDPAQSVPLLTCATVYPAGANTSLFCDEKLDAAIATASAATGAERDQAFQEAARLDNALVPYLWLWVPDTVWATSDRLQGFEPHGDFTNGFWNAADWTISE